MTDEMLELAHANAARAGAENVEFMKGDIKAIPLPDDSVDVVVSNRVFNLSTDKPTVFAETYVSCAPGDASASVTSSPTINPHCRTVPHAEVMWAASREH